MMNPWIYVAAAICGEVIGTTSLRASDGFSRLGPSLLVVLGYGGAFWLMSFAVRQLPVGTAYAVWAGSGTALAALISWTFLGDAFSLTSLLGITLIIAGVLVLNLTGAH